MSYRYSQVFLTGGFSDVDGQTAATNGDKVYEYVVNSHFRQVAQDNAGAVGGSSALFLPKLKKN